MNNIALAKRARNSVDNVVSNAKISSEIAIHNACSVEYTMYQFNTYDTIHYVMCHWVHMAILKGPLIFIKFGHIVIENMF